MQEIKLEFWLGFCESYFASPEEGEDVFTFFLATRTCIGCFLILCVGGLLYKFPLF